MPTRIIEPKHGAVNHIPAFSDKSEWPVNCIENMNPNRKRLRTFFAGGAKWGGTRPPLSPRSTIQT